MGVRVKVCVCLEGSETKFHEASTSSAEDARCNEAFACLRVCVVVVIMNEAGCAQLRAFEIHSCARGVKNTHVRC